MATTLASQFGIESLAAAVLFAILYVPLLVFFISKTLARPVYVYVILTFFCAIRVIAFILRILLFHVSDANNLDMLIAYEIIYNTGFFGLLYATYTLVTDRYVLPSTPHPLHSIPFTRNPPNGPISRLLRFRFLFCLALMAAVSIGITGVILSSSGTTTVTINIGNILRKIAIYIFFVCALLVFLQTFFLACVEFSDDGYRAVTNQIGSTYGIYVLLVISLLLVVREAFFTATADNPSEQNNEVIWYPLFVVTEFIAVVLFATPGLVP